ncbi:lycopene cyclase family protein [Streptomyces zhihengii]|uniref:lycopene cyclase family protein n=1 Tax=Streptomyces zhihengii TaxID=1818004 RepID=UPI003640C270
MTDADVVIVGAGAAGLSLAHALTAVPSSPMSVRPAPRVVLIDAPSGSLRPPERTWCFWERGEGEFEDAVVRSWSSFGVRGPRGQAWESRPHPWTYKMIRSRGFEELVGARLDATSLVTRLTAAVDAVRDDDGGGVRVSGTLPGGRPLTLRAHWAYDSRPLPRLPPHRTALLQHFRGWFVRADGLPDGPESFGGDTATLMDFRTPQPAHGLSFGYLLPLGGDRALIEYTEFSSAPLSTAAYEAALHRYTTEVLRLRTYEVQDTEQGVIPMTDARFPRRAGDRVFRIGTSGGATRPATGYTFSAVQRQSRAIVDAWRTGKVPSPPRPHARRSRAMDAVMLRALDTGRVDGADFFAGLFGRVPMERMLRFLDGGTRVREDLLIGCRTPVLPMLRTVAELPFRRRRATSP